VATECDGRKLTINVYVFYTTQNIILTRANPLQGPAPTNGQSNGFAPIKIINFINFKRHIKTGT
jgi:hypothetical protein